MAPPKDEPLGPGARLGLRIAQVSFFSILVWVIVSGSGQILADAVFRKAPPRDVAACRLELASLRARLSEASLASTDPAGPGELGAVAAFRAALGPPEGRAFDQRVYELVDGCPPAEAQAAYALARLRAADEAMLRLDALEAAPARAAHKAAAAKTKNVQ